MHKNCTQKRFNCIFQCFFIIILIFQTLVLHLICQNTTKTKFSRLNLNLFEMKTKLLTLALFGIMSLSFVACTDEEIAPSNDVTTVQSGVDCECEGGLLDREPPR